MKFSTEIVIKEILGKWLGKRYNEDTDSKVNIYLK